MSYAFNLLKGLDVMGNVALGGIVKMFGGSSIPALGSPHYTMSEAFAEMRDLHAAGEPLWVAETGTTACRLLTSVQNHVFGLPGDHCTQSMSGVPTDIGDSA